MMRSLKSQAHFMAPYMLATVGAFFLGILYAWATGSGQASHMIFYSMAFIIGAMFTTFFLQNHFATATGLALSMGATRRGWFGAALITKPVYALVCAGGFALLAEPLAMYVFGQPFQMDWMRAALLFAVATLLASVGALMGYLSIHAGAKGILLFLLGVTVVLAAAFFFALWRVGVEPTLTAIVNFIASPAAVVAAFVLCVPCEVANWAMLRRMAVRG